MKGTFLFVLATTLLAGSAFGAGTQPVVAFTFVCNGSPSLGQGTCPNGAGPTSLIQGSDGNFYGTAMFSAVGQVGNAAGTVFSLTPAGKFTLLHTFLPDAHKNFPNGASPTSLVEGHDGNLYGLTNSGGNVTGSFAGSGVVFRMSKTGANFRVIHRFCSTATCSDGVVLASPLLVGKDGNLYGATSEGGMGSGCGQPACGIVYRVTPPSGTFQVVANFNFSTDGGYPQGLALAPDGTFYGISSEGGKLFHFTPATGALQTTAMGFPFPKGCPGVACFANGIFAVGPTGNVYGYYSVYDSPDTGIFEVQPDGSNLKFFPPSGSGANLLLASDGNFWIPNSASSVSGDIVALSPVDGTVLHTLTPFSPSAPVGTVPSWLIQAKDGTLWGTTSDFGRATSGHFGSGTVYSLKLGLPPS
jgi:uncharacterized repeat protein (TIGR03803 family)